MVSVGLASGYNYSARRSSKEERKMEDSNHFICAGCDHRVHVSNLSSYTLDLAGTYNKHVALNETAKEDHICTDCQDIDALAQYRDGDEIDLGLLDSPRIIRDEGMAIFRMMNY